jgi:hypothetical protein
MALTDGSYAELIHLCALSKGLAIPIQSYCIPGTNSIHGVHPYTVLISDGDYASGFAVGNLTVMWTVIQYDGQELPNPNHIVLLVPRSTELTSSVSNDEDYLPDIEGPADIRKPTDTCASTRKTSTEVIFLCISCQFVLITKFIKCWFYKLIRYLIYKI